jgi:hypothetical protein
MVLGFGWGKIGNSVLTCAKWGTYLKDLLKDQYYRPTELNFT